MIKASIGLASVLFFSLSSTAATRTQILETPLNEKSCILIDADSLHENPEIDFFSMQCPALDGFKVTFGGGDLRSTITLEKGKDSSVLRLVAGDNEMITFPYVSGETLYWLAEIKNNKSSSIKGLMFEMSGQDESGEAFKDISFYVIAKVTGNKACVTGRVEKDVADSEATAKKLLENVHNYKCKN